MSNNLVVAIADCFSKISRLLLIFLFCILFPISGQTQSFTETALTAANAAHNADLPSWQPNGETILYTRYYNSGSYQYYNHNIFSVLGNASTISETQVVNFTVSGDFPVSISWFGATPIIAEQSGWAHEYLSFIIPSTLPLTRSVNDGSSSGFSVKLKGNNNMVAGDVEWGDLVRVSRDGSTVLIRWASLKDASYNRTVKIYTGPYSSMAGQFMVNGTEPHWEDASGVVNHPSLTTTQHYMTVQEATYQFGASLTPDGSKFAITDGSNIWLLNSDGSGTPMKIAPGVQNQSGYTCYNCVWYRYPEISPDGSKLLVSKQTTNAA